MDGIDPPKDPNSLSDQKDAKGRCRKAAEKLTTKAVELEQLVLTIGKTKDAVAVSVKQAAKELKVKISAQAKLLAKFGQIPDSKVIVQDLKGGCITASEMVDRFKTIKMSAKPYLPSCAGSTCGG